MNGRPIALMALCVPLLGCWPATEEDRKALTGLWIPDDGSRLTIEFKPDGVFDFVYDVGPPRTVLRIKWSLDTKGKVDIRADDGSRYKTAGIRSRPAGSRSTTATARSASDRQ